MVMMVMIVIYVYGNWCPRPYHLLTILTIY